MKLLNEAMKSIFIICGILFCLIAGCEQEWTENDLESKIDKLEDKIEDLESRIDDLEDKIEDLENMEWRIEELEEKEK